MPINREKVEEQARQEAEAAKKAFEELKKEVVDFLSKNPEEMFTAKEIFQAIRPNRCKKLFEFEMNWTLTLMQPEVEMKKIENTYYYGIKR